MLTYLRKTLPPTHPLRMLWYRFKGILAAFCYGFPGRGMVIIGITGTNGKTTTTHLTEGILHAAGKKTAMISTVEFRMNGVTTPNYSKLTTLSPFATQKFLRHCQKLGVDHVVIECSSHAIHQGRLFGIPFSVAALTNITHEHLDYHGTMEEYKNAKKILFKKVSKLGQTGCHIQGVEPALVLNNHDVYFNDFMSIQGVKKLAYGILSGDVSGHRVQLVLNGTHFDLHHDQKVIPIRLHLPGEFNVQNALAAASVGIALNLPLETIKKGLESVQKVPGRLEFIKSPHGYQACVDFALTPDALQKLYETLRQMPFKRIIGIIGSCGDRDKEKRPMMGKIVATYTDLTIVTDEEPYTEDPQVIMQAVLKGALQTAKKLNHDLFLIEDRKKAIQFAAQKAEPGDLIVVTGMGAFTTRTMNSGPIKWDEREVVKEIIHSV